MIKKKRLFGGMFDKKQKNCHDMGVIDKEDSHYNTELTKKIVIKIVGTGCTKCNKLAKNAMQAANELDIDFELIKISDLMEIAATGVMRTPGLIIDNKIVSTGKVHSVDEIKILLSK